MQLEQVRNNDNHVAWHKQPQIMLGGACIFLSIIFEVIFLISEYIKPQILSNPLFTISIIVLATAFIAAIVFLILGAKNIVSWRKKMLPGPKF